MILRSTLFLIISILIALSYSNIACADHSPEKVKIGIVMGLTGGASFQAAAVKEGIDMALQELQDDGKELDLAWEDDKTTAAGSVSAVHSLSARGYKLIIGPLWDFQVLAVRPILKKENVLIINPTGSSDTVGGKHPHVFNLCAPRTKQEATITNWLSKKEPLHALILSPNNAWGEFHRRIFANAIINNKGTILKEEGYDYPLDPSIARNLILKYKNKGLDSFFTTGSPADISEAAKVFASYNMTPLFFATQDLQDALTLGVLEKDQLPAHSFVTRLRVKDEFREFYRKKFNKEPFLYTDRGYRALKLFFEAASNTNGKPKNIAKYFSKKAYFDSNGDDLKGEYEIHGIHSDLSSDPK